MATPKSKAILSMTLVILFAITLVTGKFLHIKKHGIIIELRSVIKIVHWISDLLMVDFASIHSLQFKKIMRAMKAKFLWLWVDTWVVIVFTCLTFITGIAKLLSPVKIIHLGMWHYWFGIIMTAAVLVHLYRGIPSWNRLRRSFITE